MNVINKQSCKITVFLLSAETDFFWEKNSHKTKDLRNANNSLES